MFRIGSDIVACADLALLGTQSSVSLLANLLTRGEVGCALGDAPSGDFSCGCRILPQPCSAPCAPREAIHSLLLLLADVLNEQETQ